MDVAVVVDWVRNRVVEPTSWIAVGVGALILSMCIPAGGLYFLGAAAVTVVAGIFMKEQGSK
jgi:hypothetical protein